MTSSTTSTTRPSPICPYHPECPGCPLLSANTYEESFAIKRDRVEAHLIARKLSPTHPIEALPAQVISGWRARARYVVDRDATEPAGLLGFYRRGTRELLPIAHCQAHRPDIEQALDALKPALFDASELLAMTAFVEARQLHHGGESGAPVHVTLCLRGVGLEDAPRVHELAQALQASIDASSSIVLAVRLGGKGASIGSGETHTITPDAPGEDFALTTSGRVVTIPSGSFFQQHPGQLLAAHELMLTWLDQSRPQSLLDLYCGVGVHGLALLDEGGSLLATDVDEDAIETLTENARNFKDIDLTTSAASDSALRDWLTSQVPQALDLLVTNPGRDGMHPDLTGWLVEQGRMRSERGLLYMSCSVETLTRDIVRLVRDGAYTLERLAILDMMPFTEQIELLAMLVPSRDAIVARASSAHAFDLHHAGSAPRPLSVGVSGVNPGGLARTTWLAVVTGKPTQHGKLPHAARQEGAQAEITCTRLFTKGGHVSGVKLECVGEIDDEALRVRLRAWGHPVLGDDRFGSKKANRRARLRDHVDRLLLHCVQGRADQDEVSEAPIRAPLDLDWPLEYVAPFEQTFSFEP